MKTAVPAKFLLFTDGSVNTRKKTGYGAYLLLPLNEWSSVESPSIDSLKKKVQVKRFEDTSSTKLELQTFIWAVGEIQEKAKMIEVYTDSQLIIGLPGRRKRLESNDYHTSKNKLLRNHELYRDFYKITDLHHCVFIKVHGHLLSDQKDTIDRIFTLVDRASRRALRAD